MAGAFLLTGRPGVGKTTIVQEIVARLGPRAGGFYTVEIREGGRRTGFRLIALDGPVGTLASVNGAGQHRVNKYVVQIADLDRVGVGALRRAMEQPQVQVLVIDEVGKMELFSPGFREVVRAALAGPKPVLATVMAGSHPWVDAVKALPGAVLVHVTLENREAVPDHFFRWLRDA